MKKILSITFLLLFSFKTMASPGSFKNAVTLFNNGGKPALENFQNKKLAGGCFTEFSDAEFIQNFEVTFKKNNQNFSVHYFDPEKGVTTSYERLVVKDNLIETQNQILSEEAYFKMAYKENGKYLIEAITLHDVRADQMMILNMCYYNL